MGSAVWMWAAMAWGGPTTPPSSELLARLEGLRTVGSVLYVAAHPDDENTRLLAYLVGERGLDVTYLSLTRGGGGQNLIGTEQSELLGVVRTGELLAARSIDGAGQRFSRARDFGYSKSPEESLAIWGHDEVLADVVQVVRELRPDVIITRFSATEPSHGHHVASAILAGEAFVAAADPAVKTAGLAPWQAGRLLRNESSWRIDETTDVSAWLSLDVGGFDARTGRSWGEVAAASRTMHKSQGFGSAPSVGPQLEYFSGVAGAVPALGADLLDGLDLSWARVPGGVAVDKALAKAVQQFDPRRPDRVLPWLAKVHAALARIDDPRATRAQRRLEGLMVDCAGLWLTARVPEASVRPGATVPVTLTALARGSTAVELQSVTVGAGGATGGRLAPHGPWTTELSLMLPADQPLTRPHWLMEPPTFATYTLPEGATRTVAEVPGLTATFLLDIAGVDLAVERPVEHAWTDRVLGERRQAVEVLPAVTVTPARTTRLVPAGQTVPVSFTVRGHGAEVEGTLHLTAPQGGEVEPSSIDVFLDDKVPEQVVTVSVTPGTEAGLLQAEVEVDGVRSGWAEAVIDHAHLAKRTVLQPASVAVVPVVLDRGGVQRVAYVQGSGDTVDEALSDLGYDVEAVDVQGVRDGKLAGYDAVVLGIRAFNTHEDLVGMQPQLLDYVAGGGRVLVQYNTNARWSQLPPLGPAEVVIGRDRVTDETASMMVLDPEETVVRFPNALGDADFDGWVQERGLYFASTWSKAGRPVFRMHDAGEAPLDGALIVAPHGDGVFVYSGLSWFRQLPAGVPGAARLLANVLALTGDRDE